MAEDTQHHARELVAALDALLAQRGGAPSVAARGELETRVVRAIEAVVVPSFAGAKIRDLPAHIVEAARVGVVQRLYEALCLSSEPVRDPVRYARRSARNGRMDLLRRWQRQNQRFVADPEPDLARHGVELRDAEQDAMARQLVDAVGELLPQMPPSPRWAIEGLYIRRLDQDALAEERLRRVLGSADLSAATAAQRSAARNYVDANHGRGLAWLRERLLTRQEEP